MSRVDSPLHDGRADKVDSIGWLFALADKQSPRPIALAVRYTSDRLRTQNQPRAVRF